MIPARANYYEILEQIMLDLEYTTSDLETYGRLIRDSNLHERIKGFLELHRSLQPLVCDYISKMQKTGQNRLSPT